MLIRSKLILRFTLLVLVIQLLFSAFIYSFYASWRSHRFAERLTAEADLAARLLLVQENLDPDFLRTFRPHDEPNMIGEELSVFDDGQRLIYSSGGAATSRRHHSYLAAIKRGEQLTFTDGATQTVGLTRVYNGHPYVVFEGGIDIPGFEQLQKLRLILLAANIGTLVLIVLAGRYFADKALRPISRVVEEVERITASKLDLRVSEGNGTDEIAQLGITFNRMLDGLEQAFESQRSFVSHASHELRTPLATLLGTLETAAAYDKSFAETQLSIGVAMAEIKRLIDLTNGLLVLARADESTFRGALVRLDDCLMQAMAYCQSAYPQQRIQLTFGEIPDSADAAVFEVLGNAQLLTTALLNILDNACKYSDEAVTVELDYADETTLRVRVTDRGPGLEPAELNRVFEPLYRVESSRYRPGHGIGLAVVQKVVRVHGGQIELQSVVGVGTTAILVLPTATQPVVNVF
jgi:signal transduction histidine kinase